MSVLLILFLVLLPLLVRFYLNRDRPRGAGNLPPGPGRSLPLLGHLYMFGSDPISTFMDLKKDYGGIFMFDFGPKSAAIIADGDLIDQVIFLKFFLHKVA